MLLGVTHFIIWATPMNYINGKGRKLELEEAESFNQLYRVQIMFSVEDGHAHLHTYPHEQDFKKSGHTLACNQRAPGLNNR